MKKVAVIIALLVLFTGVAFAQTPYDHETAVKVMDGNFALLPQITAAAAKNDFGLAAEKLMVMAQGMNKMVLMAAPKGDQAVWESTLRSFLNAAYKGIGACGNQDAAGLGAAITDIKAYMKVGHGTFRF